jgi:hypothetical protein
VFLRVERSVNGELPGRDGKGYGRALSQSSLGVDEREDDEPTTEVEADAQDLSDDDLELDPDQVEGVVGGAGGTVAPHGPAGPGG